MSKTEIAFRRALSLQREQRLKGDLEMVKTYEHFIRRLGKDLDPALTRRLREEYSGEPVQLSLW